MKINYPGVNNHQKSDFFLHRESSGDYLFVLFKTPSIVLTKDGYKSAYFGQCIIYGKKDFQSYRPENCEFVHDFIHFDFENEYEASAYNRLPTYQLMYLPNPEEITDSVSEIVKTFHTPCEFHGEILSHLAHIFLLKLCQQLNTRETDIVPYHKELITLRANIYNNPGKYCSVKDMLPEINISASYFHLLYKKCFGISCINDLINARISQAREMLKRSDMKLTQIAELCGYNNVEHFIRQFKKSENVSPLQYKKINS